jgi:hypothetical protein
MSSVSLPRQGHSDIDAAMVGLCAVVEVNELIFDSEFSEYGQGDRRGRPIVWVVVIAIGAVGDSSAEVLSIKRPGVREDVGNRDTTKDQRCKGNSELSCHLCRSIYGRYWRRAS